MRNIFRQVAVSLAVSFGCFSKEAPNSSKIQAFAQSHLLSKGILKEKEGFVYVDLDDAFIYDLFPLIEEEGFEMPPYFGKEGLVGAHITVIDQIEAPLLHGKKVKECGKEISFTLKECKVVSPPSFEKAYLITVEAPMLDQIREKYGFSHKKWDFHITIGIKPKQN